MFSHFRILPAPTVAPQKSWNTQTPTTPVAVLPQLQNSFINPLCFAKQVSDDEVHQAFIPTTQDHTSPLPVQSQGQHPSFSAAQKPTTPEYHNPDTPTQDTIIHTNQELPIPNTTNLVQPDDLSWKQQEPTLPTLSEENDVTDAKTTYIQTTLSEENDVTDAKTTYIQIKKRKQSGTLPSAKNMIDALKLSYLKHHSALAFIRCSMQSRQSMNTDPYPVQALDDTGQPSSATAHPSKRMLTIQSQRHALETKTNNICHQLTSTLNTLTRHYKTLEAKAQRSYNPLSKYPVHRFVLYKAIGSPHNAHSYKEFKNLIDLLHQNHHSYRQQKLLYIIKINNINQ